MDFEEWRTQRTDHLVDYWNRARALERIPKLPLGLMDRVILEQLWFAAKRAAISTGRNLIDLKEFKKQEKMYH